MNKNNNNFSYVKSESKICHFDQTKNENSKEDEHEYEDIDLE